MTLSLTLFSTESSKTKRSVTPSHSYLLGVWLGAFVGLVAWFAGAALSVYAWLINDDALQRRGHVDDVFDVPQFLARRLLP